MSVFRLTDVPDNLRESKGYWNDRLKEHWNKPMHGVYLDLQKIAVMDQRNRNVIASLLSWTLTTSREVRVLECACGYGRYASFVSPLCDEYVGIDFASKNIEEARALYKFPNARFEVADMMEYHTAAKFDFIFMVTAYSSIEQNSAEIVKHLRGLLAPGGKIAIFEEHLYMVIDG